MSVVRASLGHHNVDLDKYYACGQDLLHILQVLCSVCFRGRTRVDRVLGFFSSRPNWYSRIPSPAGECVPSRLVQSAQGEGYTLACGRGGGGWGLNSDEGTDTAVLQ